MTSLCKGFGKKTTYFRCFVAACVVSLMYIVMLAVCGIIPFGTRNWLIYDMRRQYMDFFSYYRSIVNGQNDIRYSLSMSLGSGAVGFFTYYLTSPWMLLTLLYNRTHMPEAITLIVGVKLAFIAFFGNLFLEYYREKCAKNEEYRSQRVVVAFSVAYTFSAFIMSNLINPMWLDVFYMMPLVLYMLDRLIFDNKKFEYILCLAFMIWCNYYIAFMVCIFIVMWTVYRCFCGKCGVKPFVRMALCSLLGVGIDAAFLIPTVVELNGGPKDIFDLGLKLTKGNLNIFEVLSKVFCMSYDSNQTMSGTPLIYAGVAVALLTMLFFCNKAIDVRERIGMAVMMVIFLVSFCLDKINLLWHAGMEPSGYPYREAFMMVFLCCVCACRCIDNLQTGIKRIYIPAAAAVLGCLLLWARYKKYGYVNTYMLMANALLVAVYAILLWMIVSSLKKGRKKLVEALLILLVTGHVLEMTGNGIFVYVCQTFGCEENYEEYRTKVHATQEMLISVPGNSEELFRTEDLSPREKNDGMMYDYCGVTHYSSSGTMEVRRFLQKLGYNDDNLYAAYGRNNTVLADSILGIKYVMDDVAANRVHPMYDYVNSNDVKVMLANPYAASCGMIADEPVKDNNDTQPFEYQQMIWNNITGTDKEIFDYGSEIDMSEYRNENDYLCRDLTWMANCDGEVYFFIDGIGDKIQDFELYRNGEFLTTYGNYACRSVLNMGYYHKGQTVTLTIVGCSSELDWGEPLFVTECVENIAECSGAVMDKSVSVNRISSSHLYLDVSQTRGAGVLLTIPYETSWKVYEDGQRTDAVMAYDALMFIPIHEGCSKIELQYVPKGLHEGMVVSITAILIIAGIAVYKIMIGRKKTD